MRPWSRRQVLGSIAAVGAALPFGLRAAAGDKITRPIPPSGPVSGERIPAIGMGSWLTFDVEAVSQRATRVEVLRTFFDRGGAVIDSSPMYGSSEEVIGYCLDRLDNDAGLFAATKVWTPTAWMGVQQMKHSEQLWGTRQFDLMQIHNMVDWETHLETLQEWKAAGRVRYVGITTSHGRRHREIEAVMRDQPFDAVQFTYNIVDREAEQRLLPLAAERGLAVIINRPFKRGALFDRFQHHPLPDWVAEFDCSNWAQFFLKFVISHPAVTCAIPATSRVDHMIENMGALYGRLPDAAMHRRMVDYVESF